MSDVGRHVYRTSQDDILEAMDTYGGGFVRTLAHCFRAADSDNRRTLESAFRKYFIQYDEMALLQSQSGRPSGGGQ